MEIESLDYSEFELLVGLLLQREGYRIIKTPAPPGRVSGADYEVMGPDGRFIFVEVKHLRRSIPLALIHQFTCDIDRLRASHPDGLGMLVVSGSISARAREFLRTSSHITVWDGAVVNQLLQKNPDIAASAQRTAAARKEFLSSQASLLATTPPSRSADLIARIRGIRPGKDDWRDFEEVCVDILSHVFSPALGVPEIQNRSDDGLDIIDAIYPIRSRDQPWSSLRLEYRTRFVVAEFKNYSDPIGQRQVEAIAQYLWRPAQRNFGLLVSRTAPAESAILARRRIWLEAEKCVVFLEDDDLVEMLHAFEAGSDPFEIVDAQLEEFLRGLNP